MLKTDIFTDASFEIELTMFSPISSLSFKLGGAVLCIQDTFLSLLYFTVLLQTAFTAFTVQHKTGIDQRNFSAIQKRVGETVLAIWDE